MDKKNECRNPEIWGGIECTINRVGDDFLDQLECANYYKVPQHESISGLGIKKLRFPVLWEKHQPQLETNIDWTWIKEQLEYFRSQNIDVIAGLVHHGSGPNYTNLLDPQFPYLLADYAKQVATEFPWIEYYTPVNEPLTTARFSGLYGLWFPHAQDDSSFLKALINQLKGVVLSMEAIRKINPKAKLVQTEDLGKTYSTPLLKYQAKFENERRWLTYDLLLGKVNESHKLWKYFKRKGIPESELQFFLDNPCVPDIIGYNHYVTSERYLDEKLSLYPPHTHGSNKRHRYADVEAVRVEMDEEIGLKVLLEEAWNRYQLPMAITEVHLHCHREEQLRWFQYVWDTCIQAKQDDIEIVGVTAWALLGSCGWDRLLTAPNGTYEPGVYDLRSGKARSTALTAFIKNLAIDNDCYHPLSQIEGWWKRETRFLYPEVKNTPYRITEKVQETQPVLIIGKNGTLGKAFAKVCEARALHHHLMSRDECDISNPESIRAAIEKYKPWAIINAAGFVRVDDAEHQQEACFRDNQLGPFNLASLCKEYNLRLATFSSDLVFDGLKNEPYVESDNVNPLNVYGKSKALSEEQVLGEYPEALVIRTSAFFGPWDQYNFLHWVQEMLSTKQVFEVANDVYISPTYVPDLVHATLDLLIDEETGIWHLANKGAITWADLAYETARLYQLDNTYISAVPLVNLKYPAARPYYSVLGTEKGHLLPSLENALERYFVEIKKSAIA
jgi:dTDP-4-dehydrorhamnose reductase